MQKDFDEELARLDRELQVPQKPEISDDELLNDIMELLNDTPEGYAFDDPQTIRDPEEPAVYYNHSNNYGRERKAAAEKAPKQEPDSDKATVGLMITASALCLGIIGILIYWLVAYL